LYPVERALGGLLCSPRRHELMAAVKIATRLRQRSQASRQARED
jgi:hypothetical protein